MAFQGTVVEVQTTNAGTRLVGDAGAGDSQIVVASVADFHLAGGTIILTDDTGGDTTTQTIGYTSGDVDTKTLVLDGVLASDFADGSGVMITPLAPHTYAYIKTDSSDVPLPAVVNQELRVCYRISLGEGIRAPGTGVSVIVDEVAGRMQVITVIGVQAELDASLVVVADNDPIPPIFGGGGGGGLDGGNDDDGFVLPTLSSWVPDGDPDLWVQASHVAGGPIYTEDEVWEKFDSPTFVWAEFAAGDMFYEFEPFEFATLELQDQMFFPAWSMPLVGQDMKVTVDDITTTGVTTQFWNDGVQFNLFFGSFSDDPVNGKYYSHDDQVHYQDVWNNTTHAKELYRREWADSSGGTGIDALPMSSSTETRNDPHVKGVLVFFPSNWTTYPGPYTGDAIIETATLTNVHMEQV